MVVAQEARGGCRAASREQCFLVKLYQTQQHTPATDAVASSSAARLCLLFLLKNVQTDSFEFLHQKFPGFSAEYGLQPLTVSSVHCRTWGNPLDSLCLLHIYTSYHSTIIHAYLLVCSQISPSAAMQSDVLNHHDTVSQDATSAPVQCFTLTEQMAAEPQPEDLGSSLG